MNRVIEFEYGGFFEVQDKEPLKRYLEIIWAQYTSQDKDYEWSENEEDKRTYQGFLTFDDSNARAKNFVGFIQTKDSHIEIYPKVFREQDKNEPENRKLFLRHIFYWFEYCRKWKFPFTNVTLDLLKDIDFPELIINLMASKILEVVSASPISLYQELEESLMTPRGRINFNRYIAKGFANGNHHILECDYQPLLFDNTLNRVIKYASRILQRKAKFNETQYKLSEIVFILDEVEDIVCTVKDLDSIKLNTFFTDYEPVINICRMVLEQQIYNNEHFEQPQWCLLFPMEYIFEDFVCGFLETHFSKEWIVEYQKSEMYLVGKPYNAFQMRHDILLTLKKDKSKKIIVDTKYKVRSFSFKDDPKKNVSQQDMYQMTSYAFRRGCENILLLYPNCSESLLSSDSFTVESGFNDTTQINITVAEIPFWSLGNFSKKSIDDGLKNIFHHLLKSII